MSLFTNRVPLFTEHAVRRGLLRQPIVLVDVGVNGGESARWNVLGDHLVVHGFDAVREVVDDLTKKQGRANRTYHWCALGEQDGELELFYSPHNTTNSSFYQPGDDRFHEGKASWESRKTPVRTLDGLIRSGQIPAPHFLKVDVEGFERAVFAGARETLSGPLCAVEFETSFNVGPEYPNTHFGTIQDFLLPHGFTLHDLGFNRVPRASYQKARREAELRAFHDSEVGRPATFDVLFCRDPIAEADAGRSAFTADDLVRYLVIFELYGLVDVAYDLTVRFADVLGRELDLDRIRRLLLRSSGERWTREPYRESIPRRVVLKARALMARRLLED